MTDNHITDTDREYLDRVFAIANADDSEQWVDLIDLLVDFDGTWSFMTPEQQRAPLTALVAEATDEQMRLLRLAAEICPVHHTDAQTCADEFGGSGLDDCHDPTGTWAWREEG